MAGPDAPRRCTRAEPVGAMMAPSCTTDGDPLPFGSADRCGPVSLGAASIQACLRHEEGRWRRRHVAPLTPPERRSPRLPRAVAPLYNPPRVHSSSLVCLFVKDVLNRCNPGSRRSVQRASRSRNRRSAQTTAAAAAAILLYRGARTCAQVQPDRQLPDRAGVGRRCPRPRGRGGARGRRQLR